MSSANSLQNDQNKTGFQTLIFLLIIVLLAVFGNFLWLNTKNDQDQQYINLSTEVQVLSQQIAKFAGEAAAGNQEAFGELAATRKRVEKVIQALKNGDDEGLPASPLNVMDPLNDLEGSWGDIKSAADTIITGQARILELSDTADEFSANIPILQSRMDEVAQILARKGAPSSQIYVASQQLVLADRMLRRVGEIRKGGSEAVSAADGFGRDASTFGRTLSALLNGDKSMGIKEIQDPEALEILGSVFKTFDKIGKNVNSILEGSQDIFQIKAAADDIFIDSESLLDKAKNLSKAYSEFSLTRKFPSVWVGVGLAVLALLLIFLMLLMFYKQELARRQSTEDLNRRNQDAILRLLDEMGSLAEGDLTVKATVTEDITGAIADSVNFAIEALRSLVTTINETAVQVASAAQETQATAMHLAEAAEHQAQQITSASAAINEIAVSIDEVSKNSAESADVAQRSVSIAAKGAKVVRETIEGMDRVREQIQDTSKRIKRLGESSQEIGDIVELINDISEQTNILALNAAIQASSAGEAGRGFAVVADEVQRLAERASNATRRIETLVKTIQADTNEAVISMEQTTTGVVDGARYAEAAGEALGEIESVSNDLADLIQNISEAAHQQSIAATNISGTMNVIQEITTQTSAGTSQTAESIGNLAELAGELRRSVTDFKLPT
ncbi:MAG: methyl-accepting chemotaxis protein [bacterium]